MATWFYVPARKTERHELGDTIEEIWTVREYYQEIPGLGVAWTVDPIAPRGDTLDELRGDLGKMRADVRDTKVFLDLDADPPRLRPLEEA